MQDLTLPKVVARRTINFGKVYTAKKTHHQNYLSN